MSDRLGTAQWEPDALVPQQYPFAEGKFWLGRARDDGSPIGYSDDRHICLVSGTRAGKGASIIINNLCLWPGSAVVIDPKGENATVTAARRGKGSENCVGMGQVVHVLDPFNEAHVDERYRSSFNPLADLDPHSDETIEEVSRIANAIVVVRDNSPEPMWDERARYLVQGLILHVLTAEEFTDDERNLITVRRLITQGEWRVAAALRELGHGDTMDPPHMLLWKAMELNPAFEGIVAGIGSEFRYMMKSGEKTYLGIFNAASQNTEFLDFPGMRRVLATSKGGFKLSELKTRPEGMTIYLSLPQRAIENTHFRWLRMMITLTTTEMEITRGQPANGHPVLLVLDEFAGLKRMTAIENAAAQLAGFGVKLFFVLQTLKQLEATYKENWETFLANAGLKVFFGIDDNFTREYVSKLTGETEIIRELQSSNESRADGLSQSRAVSSSNTEGASTTRTTSEQSSHSHGTSGSFSRPAHSFNDHATYGSVAGRLPSAAAPRDDEFYLIKPVNSFSGGKNESHTRGRSDSRTGGTSSSDTWGTSDTRGSSETHTQGTGRNESVHRRPLIHPDELGRAFGRIDDKRDPRYPGLALVLVSGANPFIVNRAHYFRDAQFIDCFSPHPDHKFVPAVSHTVSGQALIEALLETDILDVCKERKLYMYGWYVGAGHVVMAGRHVASVYYGPGDIFSKRPQILTPFTGKVTATPASAYENWVVVGTTEKSILYKIPDGPLFTVKNYPDVDQNFGVDPFAQIRALPRRRIEARPKPVKPIRAVDPLKPGEPVGIEPLPFTLGEKFLALFVLATILFVLYVAGGFAIDHWRAVLIVGVLLGVSGWGLKVIRSHN